MIIVFLVIVIIVLLLIKNMNDISNKEKTDDAKAISENLLMHTNSKRIIVHIKDEIRKFNLLRIWVFIKSCIFLWKRKYRVKIKKIIGREKGIMRFNIHIYGYVKSFLQKSAFMKQN